MRKTILRIGLPTFAFTFGIATLLPACGAVRNDGNDDGGTLSGGETGDEGGTEGGQSVSIYDVQRGEIPEGSIVSLTDVVVTSPVQYDESGMFVQEAEGGEYSGIYLYLYSEVIDGLNLSPGDVLDLTGEYTEFYDFSEITVKSLADIEVKSSGPAPAPLVVNPSDIATGGPMTENYEGVLVQVDNVSVTDADLGYGEFEVADGLRVDDFFLLATDDTPETRNGDTFDAIVGPLMYRYDEFKITPRGVDDLVGWSNDTGGETDGGEPVTIYDIQQGDVSENTLVRVENVVVTTPLNWEGTGFYVEEVAGGEYSGISVFLQDPAGLSVSPGDVLSITGYYEEFFDLSEISVSATSDIEKTGVGEVPAAELVSPSDVGTGGAMAENYEGVLVSVENLTVTNADLGFGEWEVNGVLRVDDLFFTAGQGPMPAVDDTFASITGVLSYGYDEFKLEPRSLDDLVE